MYVFSQYLMVTSYLIFWATRFLKTKKALLIGHNGCLITRICGFIINGNWNGVIDSSIIIGRNTSGRLLDGKSRKWQTIAFVLICAASICLQIWQFAGIATVVVMLKTIISSTGVMFLSAQGIRITGAVASTLYATFLFLTGEYIGCVLEIVTFGTFIGSYLFRRGIHEIKQ